MFANNPINKIKITNKFGATPAIVNQLKKFDCRKYIINAKFKRWFYEKFPDASVREMERYLLVAILFDYTVEKEPEWIVKRKNNFYVDGFKKTIKGVEIFIAEPTSVTAPYKFSDKKLAESVAAVVNGETLDVTE